jgi:hypothetical protein
MGVQEQNEPIWLINSGDMPLCWLTLYAGLVAQHFQESPHQTHTHTPTTTPPPTTTTTTTTQNNNNHNITNNNTRDLKTKTTWFN